MATLQEVQLGKQHAQTEKKSSQAEKIWTWSVGKGLQPYLYKSMFKNLKRDPWEQTWAELDPTQNVVDTEQIQTDGERLHWQQHDAPAWDVSH